MTIQASTTTTRLPSRRQGSSAKQRRSRIQPSKKDDRTFVDHSYTDHAGDPVIPEDTEKIPSKGGVTVAFPEKLHSMLECAQAKGFDNIIWWQPHGRSFLIHDKQLFVDTVMPSFFKQSKLTSFQRQLNLYGFVRITAQGRDRGAYYHQLFLRGRPDLCRRMVRTRVKGNGMKAAASPGTEPNFYAMEGCGCDGDNVDTLPVCDEYKDDDERFQEPDAACSYTPVVTPLLTSQRNHFQLIDQSQDLPVMPLAEVCHDRSYDAFYPTLRPKREKFGATGGLLSVTDMLSPASSNPNHHESEPDWFVSRDDDILDEGDEVFFEGHKFCFLDIGEDSAAPRRRLSQHKHAHDPAGSGSIWPV